MLTKKLKELRDAGALFVINHSGGKDSQAMTIQLSEAGIPDDQIIVVHAELPEVDWDGIEQHIKNTLPSCWLDKFRTVRAKKTFFEMVERRFESRPDVPCWPSASTRQCTSDLKRDPIAKLVRSIDADLVVHCMGIRAEESSSRARQEPFSKLKRESNSKRTVWRWYPIFDLSESKVRQIVSAAGQQLHWAYREGMSRLSCCFCIMANQSDLATAKRLQPTLLQKYVELEERTGYTLSMGGVPLASVGLN